MTIAQNSFFIRLILSLAALIRGGWKNSALRHGLSVLEDWFLSKARESVLCRFLWRDGLLSRRWPESLTCRAVTFAVNIPCKAAGKVYTAGKRIWDGSLFCRGMVLLGGGTFVFLGLFMAVMLCAPHEIWNNAYGLIAAVVLLALFVIGSASRARYHLETERLGPYMVFYTAFLCIALAASYSTSLSLRFFLFHLTAILLVLLAVSSVSHYEQLQTLVALVVLGVSIAAVFGCYQGIVGVEVNPSQQDMTLNAGMPGRVYSVFNNPNNFAEQLVMLLPLDLALFLNSHWRGKILSLLSLCLGVAAIGFTYSRSGWIGLALAVAVFLALADWRYVILMIVLGIMALPFLPETIYNRILTIGNTEDSSTQYRFEIYDATKALMKDHWVRGVGLGSDVMKRMFHAYPTMFDGSYPIHTHNNYLQMWGETGIFGLLSYLALLLWRVKTGIKSYYTSSDKRVRRMLAASVGAFCGIMLIGVAEYTWFYPRNMFTYWFLFGLIGACVKLSREK